MTKYSYEKMNKLDWKNKSMTALAKDMGCSRQWFYKLKEKYDADLKLRDDAKRIKDMERELKECKAKLKALETN